MRPIPRDKNKFIKQYGLKNKLIVMYSGNLGLSHNVKSILEAAMYFKGNSDIEFVIIGDGAQKQIITEFTARKHLNNILILPLQDYKMLPHSMGASDIAIITKKKNGGLYSVPSKTFYFLAAGSAILGISDRKSELTEIIEANKVGEVVQPNNIAAITTFIKKCNTDRKLVIHYQHNARVASQKYKARNAELFYNCTV